MNKIWQSYHCLILIFVALIFFGCEQKPLILDIGDNGLMLDVVSLSRFNTQTEQKDTLLIGDSFKLYVGSIDETRNSQILLNINLELLQNSSICDSSTDSTISSYLELRSSSDFFSPEDIIETNNNVLGKSIDSVLYQFEAFYIPNLDSIFSWIDNSIHYQETELFALAKGYNVYKP